MVYDSPPQHDGDRLRLIMDRERVSAATVAKVLDVSPTAVGKWLRTGQLSRNHIAPLCRLLRCSADELLGLVPLATTAKVAESKAAYALMRQDVRDLVDAYDGMDEDAQRALRAVSAAMCRSEKVAS